VVAIVNMFATGTDPDPDGESTTAVAAELVYGYGIEHASSRDVAQAALAQAAELGLLVRLASPGGRARWAVAVVDDPA
jgi:hypothetical protein